MTNLTGQLKAVETAERGALRTAIGKRPFTWIGLSASVGALLGGGSVALIGAIF